MVQSIKPGNADINQLKKPARQWWRILLCFGWIILLALQQSCGDTPEEKLDQLISKSLRSNNDINEEEWKAINELVQKEQLKKYFSEDGKNDPAKLRGYILEIAERRRNAPAPPTIVGADRNSKDSATLPNFNIYIENSMSMDGYVNGNTSFESAITKLLVLIKNYASQDKLHINFINSKVYPAKAVDITNFAKKLEPKSVEYNVGGKDRGVSDLNHVFKTVLDSTQKNISILISDCIYSLGRGTDTEGKLNIQKSLTMDAFLSKLKTENLATVCLKLESEFNGNYYDKDNKPTPLANTKRPYYIWLMGPVQMMEAFYGAINPEKELIGYKNNYVLYPTIEGRAPYYTVLKETDKIGSFQPDRSSREYVHGFEEPEYKSGVLQFSVGIDMSKIPVDQSYLDNKANYKLTDGFMLVKVEKPDRQKVSRRDWVSISGSPVTHLLVIQTQSKTSIQDLTIELLRQIPGWVPGSSTIDDSNILSNGSIAQTFGLSALIEGVNDAYNTHNRKQQSFYKIAIQIKK
jgi:hypothetical protein